MSLPQLPADFSGTVKYQVRGTVAQGQVVQVEVKTLEHSEGFTRRVDREVKMSVTTLCGLTNASATALSNRPSPSATTSRSVPACRSGKKGILTAHISGIT